MKPLSDGLSKGYLAYLEHFGAEMRAKVNQSAQSGQRKSGVKGSSMEFSDFREYTAGDDIRRIDWNSFARGDRLFTKIYLEEKQADINIFIDTSKSFGIDSYKCFYCKMLAASIAYISLKNNDKVNIYAWNNGLKEWKLNSISKNSFANVVTFLDKLEFEGESNLKKTIDDAMKTEKRGISIVISDMFVQDDVAAALKALRYKKQDMHIIQLLSEADANPSALGSLRLTDCETGEFRDVTVNDRLLAEYKKALADMQSALSDYCKKLGGSFVSISTAVDIKEAIKLIY